MIATQLYRHFSKNKQKWNRSEHTHIMYNNKNCHKTVSMTTVQIEHQFSTSILCGKLRFINQHIIVYIYN